MKQLKSGANHRLTFLGASWDAWKVTREGTQGIARRQQERLQTLVSYARAHSGYFADRYREVPEPCMDIKQLPVVAQAEMMRHFDAWVTDPAVTQQGVTAFIADPSLIGHDYLGRYVVCTTSGLTGIPAILIGRTDEILSLPTQQGGMVQILQLAIATVVEEVLGVYNCQIIQMEPLKLKVRLAVKEPAEEQLVWEALQTRLVGYLAAQGITDVTIEKAPEPPQLHPKSGKFRCIERLMCSASSPCAHDKKRRFPMELSPIRGQAPAPSNHLVQSMRQHPLLFYFVIAFGLSWAYEVLVFGVLHIPFSLLLNLPLTLGPMLAAFLMTAVTQGRAGILQLLRRFVRWRAGLSWYLLVLLGVPALLLLPYLTQPGAFSAFRLPDLSFWPTYLIVYLSTLVFGGPLGEEPGWRGFALPRLEQRSGPLVGTLLLGVLWGLWHLPLFLFVPGYNGAGTGFAGILIPFVAFVIPVIAFTITFTWVFNNTRGSILLAILLHTSINTAPTMLTLLFPSLSLNTLFGLSRILMWVVAAVLIIVATRGRLSYQRYLRETALPAPLSDWEQEKDEVRLSA